MTNSILNGLTCAIAEARDAGSFVPVVGMGFAAAAFPPGCEQEQRRTKAWQACCSLDEGLRKDFEANTQSFEEAMKWLDSLGEGPGGEGWRRLASSLEGSGPTGGEATEPARVAIELLATARRRELLWGAACQASIGLSTAGKTVTALEDRLYDEFYSRTVMEWIVSACAWTDLAWDFARQPITSFAAPQNAGESAAAALAAAERAQALVTEGGRSEHAGLVRTRAAEVLAHLWIELISAALGVVQDKHASESNKVAVLLRSGAGGSIACVAEMLARAVKGKHRELQRISAIGEHWISAGALWKVAQEDAVFGPYLAPYLESCPISLSGHQAVIREGWHPGSGLRQRDSLWLRGLLQLGLFQQTGAHPTAVEMAFILSLQSAPTDQEGEDLALSCSLAASSQAACTLNDDIASNEARRISRVTLQNTVRAVCGVNGRTSAADTLARDICRIALDTIRDDTLSEAETLSNSGDRPPFERTVRSRKARNQYNPILVSTAFDQELERSLDELLSDSAYRGRFVRYCVLVPVWNQEDPCWLLCTKGEPLSGRREERLAHAVGQGGTPSTPCVGDDTHHNTEWTLLSDVPRMELADASRLFGTFDGSIVVVRLAGAPLMDLPDWGEVYGDRAAAPGQPIHRVTVSEIALVEAMTVGSHVPGGAKGPFLRRMESSRVFLVGHDLGQTTDRLAHYLLSPVFGRTPTGEYQGNVTAGRASNCQVRALESYDVIASDTVSPTAVASDWAKKVRDARSRPRRSIAAGGGSAQ